MTRIQGDRSNPSREDVLLQNRGHSSEGLMRASWSAGDWQRATTGSLLFSRQESETMRATVASCRQRRPWARGSVSV